jgi:predicted GIY-YIG superfamily endonuclease
MSTAFGYVLLSSGDRDSYFYYGVTVDPVRRLQAHLSGAKERKTESYRARGRKVSEKKTKEWAELTSEQREFRGVRMALGKRFAKAARNGWVLSLIQPCDPGVNHR